MQAPELTTVKNASDLIKLYKRLQPDGHFFSKGTMDFFTSHILDVRDCGSRKVRFVTSEQYRPVGRPASPPGFTVREMDKATGEITNVTEFNWLKSRELARHLL